MNSCTVIQHVRLIPGNGAPAIEDAALALVNGSSPVEDRLFYCGPASDFDPASLPPGEVFTMDLSGGCYTILPGLINTHVHLDLELSHFPFACITLFKFTGFISAPGHRVRQHPDSSTADSRP